MITSKTGEAHGFGSDPWKWVSFLTTEEKAAIRNGETVLVTGCPPCGGSRGTGCTVRRVIYSKGMRRYLHRCACSVLADQSK
jgi:hypothetical protein